MDVTIEAINFNHDSEPSTSATTDGFVIRKNETQALTVPEWRRNSGIMRGAPAAYARDSIGTNNVTIKAQFNCSNNELVKIFVRAIDGNQGGAGASANILGKVLATEVPLSKGRSDWVLMILDDVNISGAGVSVSDIIWRWQFSLDTKHWTEFAVTTHKIYTVLALPTEPWEPISSVLTNVQVPWTEVLDHACSWAAGAQNVDDATGRITKEINALGFGKVKWLQSGLYVQEGSDNFCCTEFLDLLKGGAGKGNTMNCSDCATAVSTFSNILGACLFQSTMGYDFYINRVRRIGEQPDGGGFHVHEVAWKGNCVDDPLFDACVELDDDPATPAFEALLPRNIPFGTLSNGYRFRLQHKFSTNPCLPVPTSRKRRRIGTTPLIRRQTSPTQIEALIDFYHFASWEKQRSPDEHLFLWHSFISGAEASGWQLQRVRYFETVGEMPPTNESWWSSKDDPEALLNLSTYECASLSAAHLFLLTVLGEHEVAYMKREAFRSRQAFGDVAFTDLEGSSLLFARGNLVVSVRNAGATTTNPADFLNRFDLGLKYRTDTDKEIEEMERFRFRDENFHVGQKVPLELIGEIRAGVQYKFFSELGEVFLDGQDLVYQPEVAGLHEVNAFGIDTDQKARKQQLRVLIEDRKEDSSV